MTTFDFAPLFRTAIGFDRMARLMDTATSAADASSYPPYNIEKTGDDTYRLTMAVAGFRPEELDLVVKDNTLVVSGKVTNEGQKGDAVAAACRPRLRAPVQRRDRSGRWRDPERAAVASAPSRPRGAEAAPHRDRQSS
jgi:HSP20 family molecular chaperone IbpA